MAALLRYTHFPRNAVLELSRLRHVSRLRHALAGSAGLCVTGILALGWIGIFSAVHEGQRPTDSAWDLPFQTFLALNLLSGLIGLPVIPGTGIEIRQNGTSYYGSLIKWEQIEAYAWERSEPGAREGDEVDILCLSGKFSQQSLLPIFGLSKQAVEHLLAQPLTIPVPALLKEAVERLLAQHVLRGTGGAGSSA